MSALIRRGSARGKHAARLTWLQAHRDAAVGVPGINEDVTDEGRAKLVALQATMREAGLFGSSGPDIQRETIRRLVSELRGEDVGVGW